MNEALSNRSIILPFCLTIITVRITTLPPNSYVTLGKSLAILGLLICKQGSSSLPCSESGKGLALNQHLASDPLFPPIKWVPFLGPRHSHAQQSGSVGSCCAHNPEVDGWKPSSASCFVFFLRELFCIFPEGGAKGARRGREGARWLEEMKDCSLSNPVARLSIPNENVGNPGVNFYSKKILRRK